MARPEALRLLGIARRDLRMACCLLDPEVEEATFDVQYRYDTDSTALGLDRAV